jgi:outer membrane protein assembly factor BamE (lipoprotein component of BamABCDE complex)
MKVQSSKFKVQMLFMALCVLLSACTFQTKHRGYVFPKTIDEDISSIKTTAQLIDAVGAPQTKTLYGDEVWIYYGADENYRGPLKHTFTDKTVLLAWVRGNSVQKIQVLHDQDLPRVKPAAGETEIPAAIELNALQELFNNIGRFSPAGLGQ